MFLTIFKQYSLTWRAAGVAQVEHHVCDDELHLGGQAVKHPGVESPGVPQCIGRVLVEVSHQVLVGDAGPDRPTCH